jgi:hypothetical protein
MKAYYLIGALGAIALAGCTVVKPVAYQPTVVTPSVAVAPAYVTPSATFVQGTWPASVSEGEGTTLSR